MHFWKKYDNIKNVNDYIFKLGGGVITIQDVAKAAGVSVATVSRVLNNSPSVRPKTVEKVMQAVEELGYRPNFLGRNLRTNRTKTVLVMVSTISNTFTSRVISSIEKTGRDMGYSVLICTSNDDERLEDLHFNLLKNRQVDGIIVMSTVKSAKDINALGKEYNIVQCSEYTPGANVPYVTIDNRLAAYEAVSHLINLGRRRIAYLGVKNHFTSSHLRFHGYEQALREAGLEMDKSLIADGDYGYRSALYTMSHMLSQGSMPDALFSISDRMAAGAIRAAKDKGIKIPEDIAVAGFDNTDISYISEPQITTVSQSPSQMGKAAMELMIKRLSGEGDIDNIIVPHKLIIRQSTIL